MIEKMQLKNVLVFYRRGVDSAVIKEVKDVLNGRKIRFALIERDSARWVDFQNRDLVVVVGGDGTFLRASHYNIKSVPMIGVNASPKKSEGFFLKVTKETFSNAVQKILDGNFSIINLTRLQAKIGTRPVSNLVLNEFYVGSDIAHRTSKYILKIGAKKECQKSSGVLVGTPSGSRAWVKSAGGKPMPLHSKKFQFVVREPHKSKYSRPNLLKGILTSAIPVQITVDMPAVLVADSHMEYKLKKGDIIRISVASDPVKFIKV